MKPRSTVLLVDDDARVLNGLKRHLHGQPYEVVLAQGAQRALEVLSERSVDVLVTDENMPEMSGNQLLVRVRDEWPGVVRIMLTGCHDVEVASRAINAGEVFRFFSKPCRPLDLSLGIRHALEVQELRRQSARLLARVRLQSEVIAKLEEESPGVGRVVRDERGAVVVNPADVPEDVEALLAEIERELADAPAGSAS